MSEGDSRRPIAIRMGMALFLGLFAAVVATALRTQAYHGLAKSPWPKFQGNLRNTGLGSGFGAKGIQKWVFGDIGMPGRMA